MKTFNEILDPIEEQIGFKWANSLSKSAINLFRYATRGRRSAAIEEYIEAVFTYGTVRGTELGERYGPIIREEIEGRNFTIEQLIVETQFLNSFLANLKTYLKAQIKIVVGDALKPYLRESKKFITYEKVLETQFPSQALARNDADSVSNYFGSSNSSTSNDYNSDATAMNEPETENNSNTEGSTKKTTTAYVFRPDDDISELDDNEFIEALSFFDQRIQDFIEMHSSPLNRLFNMWGSIQPFHTISEEKAQALIKNSVEILRFRGGSIESPVNYDLSSMIITYIANENAELSFYRDDPQKITDPGVRKFAKAQVPGRSYAPILILILTTLHAALKSMSYASERIRNKNKTDNVTLIDKSQYRFIMMLMSVNTNKEFISMNTKTFDIIRYSFKNYMLKLGPTYSKKLYEEFKNEFETIYELLFIELPKNCEIWNAKNPNEAINFIKIPKNVDRNSKLFVTMFSGADIEKATEIFFHEIIDPKSQIDLSSIQNISFNFNELIDDTNFSSRGAVYRDVDMAAYSSQVSSTSSKSGKSKSINNAQRTSLIRATIQEIVENLNIIHSKWEIYSEEYERSLKTTK